jgi:ribosomal protein L37AE/L43A
MSKSLSLIIAEIFAKPTEGKELSSQVQPLGDELRKAIYGDDTVFGKFRGLLDSFRTIIPDEKQRYRTALQALSTISKLSRQDIMKAMSNQLEELKIVEKGLMPAPSGLHDGLRSLGSRAQQLKAEVAQLRERLAQLESEEKAVHTHMVARGKDLELAEKTANELFANIGTEIGSLRKKVEELTVEATVEQPGQHVVLPVPPARQPSPKQEPQKNFAPATKKDVAGKTELKGAAPQQDTKFQRKCPMCGGPFHLLELENIWQCYTCAYEEPAADAVQSASEEKSGSMDAPKPAKIAPSSIEPASMVSEPAGPSKGSPRSGSQPGAKKKACPVCFKKMIWYPGEKVWRCPSGHHERKGGSGPGAR